MRKRDGIEVDQSLLTRAERGEYYRRSRELDPSVERRRGRLQVRTLAVVGTSAFVGMTMMAMANGGHVVVSAVLGAMMAGVVMIPALMLSESIEDFIRDRALRRQEAAYLAKIGYAERAKRQAEPADRRASRPTGDHNPYWATGEYDPARFYQIVRSHSPYELDAMRDYGMTADEWDANRPT